MDTTKVIDKIQKLLALATSDNPGEAENALLMARKLMAKHKLTEKDLKDVGPGKLNRVFYEKHTFSSMRNYWMLDLAKVIADNHCCGMVCNHRGKSTVFKIYFAGLDDDPQIANVIFDYAVDHIVRQSADKRKKANQLQVSRQEKNRIVKVFTESYAKGFTIGLRQKYNEQNIQESAETALVLVKPKEVIEYLGGMKSKRFHAPNLNQDEEARMRGYQAGYKFNPTPQIAK